MTTFTKADVEQAEALATKKALKWVLSKLDPKMSLRTGHGHSITDVDPAPLNSDLTAQIEDKINELRNISGQNK
jgi:hypothetical protein